MESAEERKGRKSVIGHVGQHSLIRLHPSAEGTAYLPVVQPDLSSEIT